METVRKQLSQPWVQMVMFGLLVMIGSVCMFGAVRADKEHNTPDMTDPRAEAVVTSVSSYSATAEDGSAREYYNVTVDFSINGEQYQNISLYNVPFHVEVNDHLPIKYDAAQPFICSVVDDPPAEYHTTTYVLCAAAIIVGICGIVVAGRRRKLQEIHAAVEEKNAELSDLESVKEGYGNYEGTAKANVEAAPFSDAIDYNQIYDENRGVMDAFYDPTAPYTGYEEPGE